MFDLGWSELLLIAAVALIIIGPKDLPQAIRTVTQVIRKLRGMAREFQSGLDDLAREAGVDEIKRDLNEFKEDYDPKAALEAITAEEERELQEVRDQIEGNSIAPPEADERPDPPDLTPEEFGALPTETRSDTDTAADEKAADETTGDDAAAGTGAEPGEPKKDGAAS
jgi:sec-independent protein translocase protein TatB